MITQNKTFYNTVEVQDPNSSIYDTFAEFSIALRKQAESFDSLSKRISEIQQNRQQLAERINTLNTWKDRSNLQRKNDFIKEANHLCDKQTNLIAINLLMLGGSMLLISCSLPLALAGLCATSYTAFVLRNNLDKDIWVYDQFPEAAKFADVKEKAMQILELINNENIKHEQTIKEIISRANISSLNIRYQERNQSTHSFTRV